MNLDPFLFGPFSIFPAFPFFMVPTFPTFSTFPVWSAPGRGGRRTMRGTPGREPHILYQIPNIFLPNME